MVHSLPAWLIHTFAATLSLSLGHWAEPKGPSFLSVIYLKYEGWEEMLDACGTEHAELVLGGQ